ncbi:PorP/SprF family type IX secretion system membrane protein [Pontibacter vulgaris]|uniref:PorP/SprF family type IX secretion system membrane protein n=1 Tax=Pontibacter vulgaris TaxID=2905679 RepID=UPI001FA6BF93|nr:PorP/SprF family type IX secretion system membrane protein [Pontibacter vulgaris]
MSVKKAICACLAYIWVFTTQAQDVQLTQQYANRIYLNPAFTGLGRQWSVGLAHRNQWPALNGSFRTNQLTADYSFAGTKSAIGLLLQQDKAGIGGLQKLQAGAIYAYHTNLSSKWAFSAGLQVTVASLRLNYDNLVFGDQLSDNGKVAVSSAEANTFEPTNYASFTAGGLLYSDNLWFSFAAAHLNKPAYGFGETTRLPIRFTATTGYKFYARNYTDQGRLFELSFTPSVTYTKQDFFSKTDIGLHTIYTPFTLGLIYKGVPVTGDANQDQALSVIAGLQLEQFKIGFSHDVGLAGFGKQAGGANEISLVFERNDLNKLFRNRSANKFNTGIVCPSF